MEGRDPIEDLIKPPKLKFEGDPDRWDRTSETLKPTGDGARGDIVAAALDVHKSRRREP